jgi:hypothetical protein
MYEKTLAVHNVLRWVALLTVLWVVVRALRGVMGRSQYTLADKSTALFATIAVDLQLLAGLTLYFVSPNVKSAMQDFGAAMKNKELRYFALEHALLMLIAIACVHVGKVMTKKATSDAARHRRALVWFGIALVLMALRTPWPFASVARPWFPG